MTQSREEEFRRALLDYEWSHADFPRHQDDLEATVEEIMRLPVVAAILANLAQPRMPA